jgi:hypothetical protein
MKELRPPKFLVGLVIFLVLWIVIVAAVRFQILVPRSILNWLGQSPNPQQAVWAFGALVASIIVGLVRLGFQLPLLKNNLGESDKISQYLAGMPLWVILIIFVISLAMLLAVFPSCRAPATVSFQIGDRDEVFHPSDVLEISPGESLTITARPLQESDILSCNWQFAGDAFTTIGESHGCEISVEVSNLTESSGFLTLQASQNFCSQNSIFSLQVRVSP